MHTLAIINPGHFHAGLVLREMHPELSKDVYIYSEAGPDLENYMKLVESFNTREDNPTSWNFHVYAADDFIERAIADGQADIAILAGKNNMKIHYIKALHDKGIMVLADKPLTICTEGVEILKKALLTQPAINDIMTERHEATSLTQRALMSFPNVFGELRVDADGSETIFKESIHHLYKTVNGAPLVRPGWYFDVNVQGDGIVDVTTHLVDVIQWMTVGDNVVDYDNDVELLSAKRWSTDIPLDKYSLVTKLDQFPPQLADQVEDGVLKLFSNGEFIYKLNGIPVKLVVIWNLQAPEGGGDTHHSVIKGTIADLVIRQGPETAFKSELFVVPQQDSPEFESALASVMNQLPKAGTLCTKVGNEYRIDIPDASRTTHEEHFAAVRNEFLEMLKSEEPANLRTNLYAKYKLLAEARKLAMS
jgi:predicted dehydrogenase